MILDDNQKKLRKQKILINKLRRHGTLPPEDTYAVSETDVQSANSTKLASQSKESLREQFPNLSETEIQILHGVGKTDSEDKKAKSDLQEKKLQIYHSWHDVQDTLDDVTNKMDDVEKSILLEMNKAHENSSFLSNTQTRLKNPPKNSTEVFNIADGFVRRIIKVAKQLSYFRSVDKDDQVALLKGSVVEIMMLRSAVNFDVKTETWNLSTASCIKNTAGSDLSSNSSSPGSAGSMSNSSFEFSPPPGGLDINKLREAAMSGADLNTLRNMARQSSHAENKSSEHHGLPAGSDVETLKQKYHGLPAGSDVETLKQKYHGLPAGSDVETLEQKYHGLPAGSDVETLKQKYYGISASSDAETLKQKYHGLPAGVDAETLKQKYRGISASSDAETLKQKYHGLPAGVDAETLKHKYGLSIEQMKQKLGMKEEAQRDYSGLDGLRNAAKAAGFDVDALRKAAMGGASLEQLSQLAHGGRAGGSQEMPLNLQMKEETAQSTSGTSISSEFLKLGNSETKTMFLTYIKFIKSLMSTISGDLMILKFLVMLALFSPDRQGIQNPSVIERYQELYANTLKKYIDLVFPNERNMFARCIMKLTDLRNVNEVHTKMLLKMQVEDIEPLLVEIFDLPQ
ncbi:uncharacterized protein LOC123559747 isoform X2 [Mercenaria mercenaria]|nr:uncharacterized protein LOC123559747 isoform X2 [Mercenaria mercenaria]